MTIRWYILTPILMFLVLLLLALSTSPTSYATKVEQDGLKLEKFSSDENVNPGDVIHYYIKLTNTSDSPITVDRLFDGRCPGTTVQFGNVIPAPPGYNPAFTEVLWEDIGLDPGETKIFHVNVLTCPFANVCGAYTENWAMAIAGDTFLTATHKVDFCGPFFDTKAVTQWAFPVWCPIQAATGENYSSPIVDLNLSGRNPVAFSRYYASGLVDDGLVNSALGGNWMHNYDCTIVNPVSPYPNLVYDRGKSIEFAPVMAGSFNFFFAPNNVKEPTPYEMRFDSGWDNDLWFFDPNKQMVYRFDVDGLLEQIIDRNENTVTITRDVSNRVAQVTDGVGRTLTFTYDGGGSLTLVSDGSRTFTYAYDINDSLISVTDPMGNVTEYSYKPGLTHGPLMTEWEQPKDNVHYTNTYDIQGRVTQQQDAYLNTATLAYDTPSAGKTTVNDPSGSHIYTHENDRLGTDLQDQSGNTFTRNFDDRERPISVDDRMGGTTRITWDDASGQIASIVNAGSEVLSYSYTPQDQVFINPATAGTVSFTFYDLTRIDYPDGTNQQFTYDSRGNMLSRRDQLGNTTNYTYDAMGNILTITNAEGGVTTYTYNPDGTMATSTNSDLGITTYEYDSLNRLIQINHPDSTSVEMTYNLNDQLKSITDERNKTYSYSYDANGNLTKAIDATGEDSAYAYDLMDRIDQTTNRLGDTATYTYDNMGRMASVSSLSGIVTNYGYDNRGWLDEVTIDGKTWQTTYNDEGIPTANTTPEGRSTTYQINELGYLKGVTDNLGNTAKLTRNSMNQVTQVTDPLNRITTYSYDDRGTLNGIIMPVIGSTAYQYNDIGPLKRITDFNGQNWDFSYTGMGYPIASTDPLANTTNYAYDNRGRLATTTFANGDSINYTYDAASNQTQAQYSGGLTFNYTYDDLNRLDTTDNLDLDYDFEGRITSTTSRGNAFGATYDADGRIQTASYNNDSMIVTYTYDPDNGRLTNVTDNLTGENVEFIYDDDGLLTELLRSNNINGAYTYDDAGRLTRIKEGGIIDLQYTLDDAGQVTGVDMDVPLAPWDCIAAGNDTFTYDDACQVNTPGYDYDARGRRVDSPEGFYFWNQASQLTSFDGADFTYDELGGIFARTEGGNTTNYYQNYSLGLNPIVAEQNGTTSQFEKYYVWTPGGRLLYMIDLTDSNKVYFYHFDRTGSTLALTDTTSNVTDSYAYTPYGELLQHDGSNDQPFTFVGISGVRQEGDNGSLYQMRARYYDAITASFISRDPVWPDISSPKSVNPYQYVWQEPINTTDPTGFPDFVHFNAWYSDSRICELNDTSCNSDCMLQGNYDLLNNTPGDCNANGIPDDCELGLGYDAVAHGGNYQSFIKWEADISQNVVNPFGANDNINLPIIEYPNEEGAPITVTSYLSGGREAVSVVPNTSKPGNLLTQLIAPLVFPLAQTPTEPSVVKSGGPSISRFENGLSTSFNTTLAPIIVTIESKVSAPSDLITTNIIIRGKYDAFGNRVTWTDYHSPSVGISWYDESFSTLTIGNLIFQD